MNRRGNASASSSSDGSPQREVRNEKIPQSGLFEPSSEHIPIDDAHDLHRGLKARHITMIAIGGAIGTGLIIGT